MSYLSSFGPTSFDISINGHDLNLCIKLTATTSPADGTYTMAVGAPSNDSCTVTTFTNVATVALDENGNVQTCSFRSKFSGRNWQSMSGVFNTDGTGSGEINDDADPTGINGSWGAGGGGKPFPQNPAQKHGHHS
jgi:hypothetical protein